MAALLERTVASSHVGGGVPEVFRCQLSTIPRISIPLLLTSNTLAGHQKHSRYAAFIDLLTAESAVHSSAASFALPSFSRL